MHRGRVKNSLFQGRVTQATLNCQENPFFTFVVYTKKNGYFTVSFLWIFLVYFWPYIMIIGVLKWMLHQKYPFFFFNSPYTVRFDLRCVECPQWFQNSKLSLPLWPKINRILTPPLVPRKKGWLCHCDLILTSKSATFDPPVPTGEGWQGSKWP